MAKLEAAATLTEVQRNGGGLTVAQSKELSQFVLELMPVYGNAESLMQVLTGRSSVSGEEANRWLAGIGLVPVIGPVAGRAVGAVADAAAVAAKEVKNLKEAGTTAFVKVEDLFGQTFDAIPVTHTKDFNTGKLSQNGDLGEQLAIQVINEKTGLDLKPLQNASNHGCDGCAIAINGDTITVVVMDAKSSQNGVNAAASAQGDPAARLTKWIQNSSIAGADKELADAIQLALGKGAKVQGITVKVGVPAPGTTGTATFKVEPWPKK